MGLTALVRDVRRGRVGIQVPDAAHAGRGGKGDRRLALDVVERQERGVDLDPAKDPVPHLVARVPRRVTPGQGGSGRRPVAPTGGAIAGHPVGGVGVRQILVALVMIGVAVGYDAERTRVHAIIYEPTL